MGEVGPSRWVEVESGVSLGVLAHLHLNSDLQDPKERLGCRPQTGFSDIKSHAFFRSIDWDLVSFKGHLCPFCEVGQSNRQNGPVCTWVPGTWCLVIFCSVVVGFPKLPRT